jgi:hypothetical protein
MAHAKHDCGSPEHTIHRRLFLKGLAGSGAISLMSWSGLFSFPAFAQSAKKQQKQCILLWAVWRAEPVRNVGPQTRKPL